MGHDNLQPTVFRFLMSGWTIMPDCSGEDDSGHAVRLTKTFGMNEEGTELAGRASAVVEGCIPLRKSFGRALSLTQEGRWRTLWTFERGVMVCTRTNRSCETLLRNATIRGCEYDSTALIGWSPGGRTEILCPIPSREEGDRRCEACCLGRFGMANSSLWYNFSILQKHMVVSRSGAL